MQPPGGFFASMGMPGGMPGGASSFMPQGAAMPGATANSLTSPPMGDQFMEMLKKLSNISSGLGQSQGDGSPSALPSNSFSPFMENGGQPPQHAQAQPGATPGAPGAAPGGASPLAGMTPDMLKQILQRLGIGPKPAGV